MSEAGGPGDREQVGSVSEEALKLFGALSDWARDHGSDLGHGLAGLAEQAGAAAREVDEVDEHLATGAAECSYCPICRTVHLVRQTSPEVRAHLTVAASSLLQAAAGILATAGRDDARQRGDGVEHIDLDTDDMRDGDEAWPEEDDE